jgi:hypothetical protein
MKPTGKLAESVAAMLRHHGIRSRKSGRVIR